MPGEINIISVMRVCKATYIQKISESETHEVEIYHSPMGEFMGTIQCTLAFTPGFRESIRSGDKVKVLCCFDYCVEESKYENISRNSDNLIVGIFEEESVANMRTENPSAASIAGIRYLNDKSNAGIIASDDGHVSLVTGGAMKSVLKPFGHGYEENMKKDEAQNFWRIISHNAPFYLSREHFGSFKGKDDDDKALRGAAEDIYINYRRFVTQTADISRWTSINEGAWDPWVGPNNDADEVFKGREVLYTRLINSDKSRITIEGGEEGEGFFTFRVDDVILNERQDASNGAATPGIFGNRMKLQISEEGEIHMSAAGSGTPSTNTPKFSMTIDKDGNLRVQAAGKITFTHGDNDDGANSLVLDPDEGIDFQADKGFRVNGKLLVTEELINFLFAHTADLILTASPGAPAPMGPVALQEFIQHYMAVNNDISNGYTTKGPGTTPASKLTTESDTHESIAA